MQHWRVVHTLERPITVVNQVDAYPSIGLELEFDVGKLIALVHSFSADGRLNKLLAVELSRRELSFIMDVLQYWWGHPIRLKASVPELLWEDTEHPVQRLQGAVVAQVSTNIARPVRLPSPESLQRAPDRLRAWLRFANEASQATIAADAVRNYYMIWEDKNGRPGATEPEAQRLRFVRDFVSHGEKLKKDDLRAFLARELGKPVVQYDPTDREHSELVDDARSRARRLIASELEPLLPMA